MRVGLIVGWAMFPAASVLGTAAITADFDSGIPAGWVAINRSSPQDVTAVPWEQANVNEMPFAAHRGPSNGYVFSNFNAVVPPSGQTGTISNWLLSPVRTYAAGDVVRFFTRTPAPVLFPDRLEVRLSNAGASTDVGSTATSVGVFTTLLTTINPTLTLSGYPTEWTEILVQVPSAGTGRVALRSTVPDAGPVGTYGDYIGVDTFSFLPLIRGDMNGDGNVNAADIAPFVQALTDFPAYENAFPFVPGQLFGDINNSGAFNAGDIAPFVQLLIGSGGFAGDEPELQGLMRLIPEPASLSLLTVVGLLLRRRR